MADQPVEGPEPKIQCSICYKEIPASEAHSIEAEEYVWYFCGPDCFAEWEEHKAGVHPMHHDHSRTKE